MMNQSTQQSRLAEEVEITSSPARNPTDGERSYCSRSVSSREARYKILYVGPLCEGGTCLQRMKTLQQLGHQVIPIDTAPPEIGARQNRLLYRIRRKIIGPKDLAGANSSILRIIENEPVDLLWLDKALTINAHTLRKTKSLQPRCKIIGYSPDDMGGSHNQSKQFLEHLPLYDEFFTTKSFGLAELKSMGCPRVKLVGNAFDPETHRPVSISREDRLRLGGPVGFIGNWERERAGTLHSLAGQGIQVRVWGPRWNRCQLDHPNLLLEKRCLWGDDYARALCAFDINLGFLSKINRDLVTTRSVEIPACGAFLLAERTSEHKALFEEGVEAEFFESVPELLDKIRYYLEHEEERIHIAKAGRARCLKNGYSNQERLRQLFEHLIE